MSRARVLLLQRIVPPFRVPFFRALAASPALEMVYGYGRAHPRSGIESVELAGLEMAPLRNHFLGEGFAVFQSGVREQLRSGRYDAVIAEFNPRIVSNVLACLRARRVGLPFLWWGHGVSARTTALNLRARLWLIRQAAAAICYDEARAELLVASGAVREKIFVAPNSIATDPIFALAEDRPLGDRHSVLYVGRLIPVKKVDLLIAGFARARGRLGEGTTLTLVGDGPERARLEALARELGVAECVHFAGALYTEDQLAPLFNAAFVSVSPGALGLSAIHSLAYGVPMLSADAEVHGPEFAALEHGANALLFGSDDAEALADGLVELASDPLRWEGMARRARAVVEARYGLDAMVDTFEKAVSYALRDARADF